MVMDVNGNLKDYCSKSHDAIGASLVKSALGEKGPYQGKSFHDTVTIFRRIQPLSNAYLEFCEFVPYPDNF